MPTEKTWNPNTKQWDTRETGVDEKLADKEKLQNFGKGEGEHKTADEVQHSGGLGALERTRKPASNTAPGGSVPKKEPLPEQTPTSSPSHTSGAAPKGKDMAAPQEATADKQADAVESSEYKDKRPKS